MAANPPAAAAALSLKQGGDAAGPVAASLISAVRGRSHATLSDGIAAEIQQLILRGELETGDRLPTELELADALAVSRSVIRDAMRALATKGLVAVRQGHGTVVALPTPGPYADSMVALLMRTDLTIGDVIAARAAFETELAPLVTERGTEEDWDAMELHLERFAAAVRDGDWEAAHDAHFHFHLVPYHALRMPALELILTPLQQCILLTSLPPTRPDDVPGDLELRWEVDIHPPILAAMRAGDGAAAREAMKIHFEVFFTDRYREFNSLPFRTAAELEHYYAFREKPAR